MSSAGRHTIYAVAFGIVCLLLQVFLPYQRYVRYLKWLTLALLSYVVLVLTIHIPWREVATRTVSPHFALTTEYLTVVVAVFGTTISPYLFFWQASQEVEELNADPAAGALAHAPEGAADHLRRIKIDTYLGHGVLEHRRVLHHPRYRGDAQCRGHHRDPDLGSGCRGTAAAGGRVQLRCCLRSASSAPA